jgi:U3 small nucleolar RNA-associated protein 14
MFYKEQKQKKIAKIKSKTYRKVHKKDKSQAAGENLSIEELAKLDPELAQEKVLKLQADRIKV